jgi:hypothetical protein
MLEERGHKFLRYADDCNIYVKSSRAAERVMESCARYLEGKLKLKVNRKKSTTGSPTELKFLGFKLGKSKENVGVQVHEKSLKRFKEKLKEKTKRKRGGSIKQILQELSAYCLGWLGYYGIADRMKTLLKELSEWLRRRIRQIFWKRWKRIPTRIQRLRELGAGKGSL